MIVVAKIDAGFPNSYLAKALSPHENHDKVIVKDGSAMLLKIIKGEKYNLDDKYINSKEFSFEKSELFSKADGIKVSRTKKVEDD